MSRFSFFFIIAPYLEKTSNLLRGIMFSEILDLHQIKMCRAKSRQK